MVTLMNETWPQAYLITKHAYSSQHDLAHDMALRAMTLDRKRCKTSQLVMNASMLCSFRFLRQRDTFSNKNPRSIHAKEKTPAILNSVKKSRKEDEFLNAISSDDIREVREWNT